MQEAKTEEIYSVSSAVDLAKRSLNRLGVISVEAEISSFRGPNARSGHCYFDVKDETASMSVIVWRSLASQLSFRLQEGLLVRITGSFDVYAGSGKMSFIARRIEPAGEGLLRQRVAELARKLEREGLMDPARKLPVPWFCQKICVVTSLSGSVIDDVKRTLLRRNPLVEIRCIDAPVQGPDAPPRLIAALRRAQLEDVDAILLVRGGGSFEDLMCFNDEALARVIFASRLPIVTGIGHEPDTTIADMVSARRASTPTAAAEGIAPATDELCALNNGMLQRLAAAMDFLLSRKKQHLDAFGSRPCLTDPFSDIRRRREDLFMSADRLSSALPRRIDAEHVRLEHLERRCVLLSKNMLQPWESHVGRASAHLHALSPLAVLSRGYAVARGPDESILKDAASLKTGDRVSVMLGRGSFSAEVIDRYENEERKD